MIKPEQIPDEAVEMALKTYWDYKSMRSSIAAAINAWPDAEQIFRSEDEQTYSVILNIPQEKNDD